MSHAILQGIIIKYTFLLPDYSQVDQQHNLCRLVEAKSAREVGTVGIYNKLGLESSISAVAKLLTQCHHVKGANSLGIYAHLQIERVELNNYYSHFFVHPFLCIKHS